MSKWQPIETAPKDGSTVLGYFPSFTGLASRRDVLAIYWSGWGGGTWSCASTGHRISDEPASWRPLPEPPSGT